NAQHIKAVPGRKTDVQDSEWIADLLRHGLLRGSFVPDRGQRELRELTRHRTNLVDGRAQVANRIQKTLEGANVKLASVASNVLGQSARAMLEALVDGEVEPSELAQHARGRMKSKKALLEEALEGSVGPHQRFLLRQLLASVDHFDRLIAEVNDEITRRLAADSDAQPLSSEPTVDGPPRSRERCDGMSGHHPWDRDTPGGDRAERGWSRHGQVPQRRTPGVLGRSVSGAQRKRRQTPHRAHPTRQSSPAPRAGRSRPCCCQDPHLSRCSVPTPSGET